MEAAGALEDLAGPPCPDGLAYLLEWFAELSTARSGSGFGGNPIAYAEILAWAQLTGRDPAPFEVRVLRALDLELLDIARTNGGPRENRGN